MVVSDQMGAATYSHASYVSFISIMFVAQFLCGYDGSVTGGMLAMPSESASILLRSGSLTNIPIGWHEDLGYPDANRIGLLNIAGPVCGVASGPFITYIADRWGRKWCLRIWGFLVIASTVTAVIAGAIGSNSFGIYILSRV